MEERQKQRFSRTTREDENSSTCAVLYFLPNKKSGKGVLHAAINKARGVVPLVYGDHIPLLQRQHHRRRQVSGGGVKPVRHRQHHAVSLQRHIVEGVGHVHADGEEIVAVVGADESAAGVAVGVADVGDGATEDDDAVRRGGDRGREEGGESHTSLVLSCGDSV